MFQDDRAKHVSVEAPADPFSLQALITWLRTKKPSESYDYTCNGRCLIGQYLMSIGVSEPCVGPFDWRDGGDGNPEHDLPWHWDDIAIEKPHTFGAALSRALSLQTEGR